MRPPSSAQDHLGLHAVIGHGEQPDAGLPAVAENPGGRGQGEAGAEHAGPVEMGGDVPVAQAEPVRPGAVGGELGQDGVGVAVAAPALLLVDPPAQGVHHGVEVGRDVEAEQADVVAGVADDGDLGAGGGGFQPPQEAGGADPAGEHGDAHAGQSGNPWAGGARRAGRDGPVTPALTGLTSHRG